MKLTNPLVPALTLLFAVTLSAAPIVKDGKATAEIVVPASASPIVKTAAMEFQNIIAKMSGAKLQLAEYCWTV